MKKTILTAAIVALAVSTTVRADFDIYFLRHGETTWNRACLLQGSFADSELTPKGVRMAKATDSGFAKAGLSFDRVYASPYLRARRTAEIVTRRGAGPTPLIDPRLREMGFGVYEGRPYDKNRFPDDNLRLAFDFDAAYRPQGAGAETVADVRERLRDFLDRELKPLDGKVKRVLCVAHAFVLRALVAELAGANASASARKAIQPSCCVHVVRFAKGSFSLVETGKVFYDAAAFNRAKSPLMVAHRGAGDLVMPEASRPAYSNAVTTACDIVKLDLQETQDGVIVMGHDPTLKRNMGWDVKISRVTYSNILEHAFTKVGAFADERIVRLDEALAIAKAAPQFWIDFKHFSPDFAERVLAEFKRQGIDESRLMVATFSRPALAYFKARHPAIRRVGHISMTARQDGGAPLLAYCKKYGLWGVNMPAVETNADDVKFLHDNGLWVSLWFVQNARRAAAGRASGADAFVTDHVSTVRPMVGGDPRALRAGRW